MSADVRTRIPNDPPGKTIRLFESRCADIVRALAAHVMYKLKPVSIVPLQERNTCPMYKLKNIHENVAARLHYDEVKASGQTIFTTDLLMAFSPSGGTRQCDRGPSSSSVFVAYGASRLLRRARSSIAVRRCVSSPANTVHGAIPICL